ncbi:RagB/SusD family nutrient uptake outer membrane protein [Sphingobacterium bovistauri]|uniref:RagB/SusD family nutrient uptake outer membrane protein n=1 Tax=Sphingobacterium bovistauri TaxID=2781959 RepID=A0ABS7Z5S7_9SPHI|nr:RagB/SusD family nutrient uptake outer membrane protein [Sphingobacterium bovistauri]MCA5004299.1 RagB/SusD family nutrient uptake outer membrane protein [Sphingobacterium bovistauri]
MKRKQKIFITTMLLAMLIFQSCEKYLDVPYDNRLEIKNDQDLGALVKDSYPTKMDMFTDMLTDSYFIYPSLMQSAWRPLYTPMYLFDDEYEANLGYPSPATAYTHFYNSIYDANYAIENASSVEGNGIAKDVVVAEALLVRAYSYFVLTNLFGKHYNTSTYDKDLSVPLVTEVNKENRPVFSRGTVKEAYDLIEADLLKAISTYEKHPSYAPTNPYQFTIQAAYAFACRFNLYKGDYQKTIDYANKTFTATGLVLRNIPKDIELLTKFGWAYFLNQMNDPSTHPNLIMTAQSNYIHYPTGNNWGGFFVSRDLVTKITSSDRRRTYLNNAGTVIDNANYVAKNHTSWGTSRYIMFGTEEVLLSRAEAYLRLSTPNKAAAITDINLFKSTRYSTNAAVPTSATDAQVLEEVLLQRQIEFLAEGLRWYDVKRLGLPVEHKLDINSSKVDARLEPNDPRTALQIPLNARIGNPILETQLNPR